MLKENVYCVLEISCFFIVLLLVLSEGYMITENGDKTGKTGHKTTWYVKRGNKFALPCHYKSPGDSGDDDPDRYQWKKPKYVKNRYKTNEDKQLVIEKMRLPDSALITCKSAGIVHKHTVLAVEEPLWANVSKSLQFKSPSSCHGANSHLKLVEEVESKLCEYDQLIAKLKKAKGDGPEYEKKCRVKVTSQCVREEGSTAYGFNLTVSATVPKFEDCSESSKSTCTDYEKVAQRLCMRRQKCHLDYMCHQNFECIRKRQYGAYQDAVRFAYDRMEGLIKEMVKTSSALLLGLIPRFDLPSEIDYTAKCAHPGYKLHYSVLCLPCKPNTYVPKTSGPTPSKCKPCKTKSKVPRYGSARCKTAPRVLKKTRYPKYEKWQRIPPNMRFTTPLPRPSTTPKIVVASNGSSSSNSSVAPTEDTGGNSIAKVVGIVLLAILLFALLILALVMLNKFRKKFNSQYKKMMGEETAKRKKENKMFQKARQKRKKKKRNPEEEAILSD